MSDREVWLISPIPRTVQPMLNYLIGVRDDMACDAGNPDGGSRASCEHCQLSDLIEHTQGLIHAAEREIAAVFLETALLRRQLADAKGDLAIATTFLECDACRTTGIVFCDGEAWICLDRIACNKRIRGEANDRTEPATDAHPR
jgi:hypothetical protein